jgi:hypothetical protein
MVVILGLFRAADSTPKRLERILSRYTTSTAVTAIETITDDTANPTMNSSYGCKTRGAEVM